MSDTIRFGIYKGDRGAVLIAACIGSKLYPINAHHCGFASSSKSNFQVPIRSYHQTLTYGRTGVKKKIRGQWCWSKLDFFKWLTGVHSYTTHATCEIANGAHLHSTAIPDALKKWIAARVETLESRLEQNPSETEHTPPRKADSDQKISLEGTHSPTQFPGPYPVMIFIKRGIREWKSYLSRHLCTAGDIHDHVMNSHMDTHTHARGGQESQQN